MAIRIVTDTSEDRLVAAAALYRRLGWRADGATWLNARSGRTMAHLILELG